MASSPKLISFLFLFTLLFLQIHARESHFFSKIPNNNNNGETETEIPNKLDDPLTNSEKTTTPQDQQPNFIPQTQDNGYGLYGHESGQFPPTDENNNNNNNDVVPYKSQSEEHYNNNNNNGNDNDNFQNSNSKEYDNSFYYNNNQNLYDNGRQNFQNTRLSRNDYTTTMTTTTPSYDQEKYNNFNNNNEGNNANNVVRQGMSDTRFMENGKYFYDLDMEPHHYRRTRGNFENNNNYNNNYNNNRNTYENSKSMGRFQNDEDAEFDEEPVEFVP